MDPYTRLLSKKSAIFFLTLFIPRFVYAVLLDIGTPYKEGVESRVYHGSGRDRWDPEAGMHYKMRKDSFGDFYFPRILSCFAILVVSVALYLLFRFATPVFFVLLSLSVLIDCMMLGCRALYVKDKLKTTDKSVPVRLEDLWSDQYIQPKVPSEADALRENKRKTGEFGKEAKKYSGVISIV